MADLSRGAARQPKPQHKQDRGPRHGAKAGKERPIKAGPRDNPVTPPRQRSEDPPAKVRIKPRLGAKKHKPAPTERPAHKRTTHDLDPREVAYGVLRSLPEGELIEPAVLTELDRRGYERAQARRVVPMLEDAVRFALLFDHLIGHVATRPPESLDKDVRAALHLFLSWYLLDDPKAVYAHGQAAVNLLGKSSARGFVNACVRRLGELVKVETGPREDYRASKPEFWRDKTRLGAGRYARAERALFADFASEPAAHLAQTCAVPRPFIERLIEQHGLPGACAVALSAVEKPATWLRVNSLKADVVGVQGSFTLRNLSAERVPVAGGQDALALREPFDLTQHPDFATGGLYAQDFSAQCVAPALQAKAGDTVLDLCSSPGGKAGHVAELTREKAKILAVDLTPDKVERIQQNIARMGYGCIATAFADAAEIRFPQRFDRVLLDAPCSNSGVLARRVEARHRLKDLKLGELARLQMQMLENAAANLKPGGTLLYSVCSVLMEEGLDIVRWFLSAACRPGEPGNEGLEREEAGWEIEAEQILLPVPAWHDGGYWCRIKAPA